MLEKPEKQCLHQSCKIEVKQKQTRPMSKKGREGFLSRETELGWNRSKESLGQARIEPMHSTGLVSQACFWGSEVTTDQGRGRIRAIKVSGQD